MNIKIATLLLLGSFTASSAIYAAPMTEQSLEKLMQLADIQNVLKSANAEIQPMFEQQAEEIVKQSLAVSTLNAKQQQGAKQLAQLMSNMNKQVTEHPKFLAMIKDTYRNTFTEEEAQANIAFLSTPLGQSITKKSAKLSSEIIQKSAQLAGEISEDPKHKQQFMQKFEQILQPLIDEQRKAKK